MTDFNPYENRIPLGLLTEKEKAILKSSGPWEIYNMYDDLRFPLGWGSVPEPFGPFDSRAVYRKMKNIVKPTVNWQYFSNSVKAVAWDKSGNGYAYDSVPSIGDILDDEWIPGDDGLYASSISLFPPEAANRGTCDWKEAIVIREEE